ncbi:MAG: radical SAM protein [Thermoguttaceae bacterium]|nr:radical SAM protein [Thermoguttaceae bacterium]
MDTEEADAKFFQNHGRLFEDFSLVYPVVSRRAGGLSVGINLSPDQFCPFRCVYCQVQRQERASVADELPTSSPQTPCLDSSKIPPLNAAPSETASVSQSAYSSPFNKRYVDLDRLEQELMTLSQWIVEHRFWQMPPFDQVTQVHQRWNDFALSGDGEPTASPCFSEAVKRIVKVRQHFGLTDVKIILITSSTCLHLPQVQEGLELLREHGGEIWAKLDAGTPEYYHEMNRSRVPFERILENIQTVSQRFPVVIQTLLVNHGGDGQGKPMSGAEVEAYRECLKGLLVAGGHIRYVQLHTIARSPAESDVSAVSHEFMEHVADRVRRHTGLRGVVYR